MPPKRRGRNAKCSRNLRNRSPPYERSLETPTQELFHKTSCIRMPPHETFAKMFRTVLLQNAFNQTTGDVTLADVHSYIRPQFGWYNIISFTVYGPPFTEEEHFIADKDSNMHCLHIP